MNVFKRDKSVSMSKPDERIVHGITVCKLPIGRYAKFLQATNNMADFLLGDMFPDVENVSGLIAQIMALDKETLFDILGKLIATVPEKVCTLVAELLEVDVEDICDLSPTELTDVLLAFEEINNLSDFFGNVRLLKTKMSARN